MENNFPPGFRVLCYNCNCGRNHNKGICPHKKPVEEENIEPIVDKVMVARDREIVTKHLQGDSAQLLSEQFGISRRRIFRILKREKER